MCAVGIGARELQIWKEVDGMFTADPTKVESARLLLTVTAEEASELTYYGSEVSTSLILPSDKPLLLCFGHSSLCCKLLSGCGRCVLTYCQLGHPPLDNGTDWESQHPLTFKKRKEPCWSWNYHIPVQ